MTIKDKLDFIRKPLTARPVLFRFILIVFCILLIIPISVIVFNSTINADKYELSGKIDKIFDGNSAIYDCDSFIRADYPIKGVYEAEKSHIRINWRQLFPDYTEEQIDSLNTLDLKPVYSNSTIRKYAIIDNCVRYSEPESTLFSGSESRPFTIFSIEKSADRSYTYLYRRITALGISYKYDTPSALWLLNQESPSSQYNNALNYFKEKDFSRCVYKENMINKITEGVRPVSELRTKYHNITIDPLYGESSIRRLGNDRANIYYEDSSTVYTISENWQAVDNFRKTSLIGNIVIAILGLIIVLIMLSRKDTIYPLSNKIWVRNDYENALIFCYPLFCCPRIRIIDSRSETVKKIHFSKKKDKIIVSDSSVYHIEKSKITLLWGNGCLSRQERKVLGVP